MDKQALLRYWAGELIHVKAELRQVSWLMQQGIKLTKKQEAELDRMLDRKNYLERLIAEFEKQK